MDVLYERAETESHGHQVQGRFEKVERKARLIQLGIDQPMPLPDAECALNPQGSSPSA